MCLARNDCIATNVDVGTLLILRKLFGVDDSFCITEIQKHFGYLPTDDEIESMLVKLVFYLKHV